VDGDTEIVGADRAEFTVTATALEETVTGAPALSVTLSSKLQDPVVDKAPVDLDAGEVQDEEETSLL
jgi:hypothetical protein